MKKWLLALMICLSFSTLTAGLFLLPQTINAVYQREQNAEEDNNLNGNVIVPVDPGGGGGSSTPASLSLYIKYADIDGTTQSSWFNGYTVQAKATSSASWSTYSYGGGGSTGDGIGFSYNLYVGYYVRFKANCKSGFAVWKYADSNQNRVWPSGDGYYYTTLTSTTTSYCAWCLSGYMVSVYAGSYGTVKPNSSASTMSSFSGGIKSGATIYSSTYNWYPSGSWSTTIDAYAVANSGYKFSSWSQSPSGSTMTANRTITANFVVDADTTNPVIHRNTYVQNGSSGYYVYTYVTDNKGVSRVQFPTWTTYNGQDDIMSDWGTNSAASGTSGSWTINGSTYNYRYYVAISSHNYEYGPYNTHIYAYDAAGNSASSGINGITFSFTLTANANGGSIPSTSGWTGTGSTATKTLTYGDAYGTLPTPTRVNYVFNGWYTAASGGVYVTTSRTMGAGNQYIYAHWTFAVEVYFITEGPGDFMDNGCIYSWDTSGDNELVVYFDYDDDIDISWDGSDMAYINIHGGDGGSFEIGAGYYFTGDVEIDYDGTVQDYNLDNGISFCCGDSALNHIYVYFYTYKYVNIGRNNTSYGTVSQSQVRVSGSTTYSISSSGSTVTINGTSVTATPAASTTGFTYAFGSWTIPSGYASQSFPTITANFTRTTNTRSVTLAVRTISEAGAVGNSNAIPSGASLAVSYTNSTPAGTGSTQTSASTAYTIQAGTNMKITPTVPAGYKYLGYSTSGSSKPSVNSFPTSTTLSAPSAGTYYFFFQKIAAPLYYTTERGGYWYYEDGEYPQTFVGTSLTGATANQSSPKFHLDWPTDNNNGDYTIYTLGASRYIQVASPMTGTIKFNGTTVSLTAGTKYWFRIDPIRWRVSNYGASASKYSLSSVTANFMGVSDILGHGRVNTNASITDTQNMTNAYQDCAAVGYTNASTNIWRDMYTYQEGSSTKVNIHITEVTQASKMLVASLDSLNTTGDIRSYASDLSAMLQCRDYNNATGWTSGMYNIGSGIAVGPGASYTGKYWGQLNDGTYNTYGFVYAHQASYATCLGATYVVKEYLQSTGTQWIDSLASIKANTHVETDLMFTGAWSYNMVFGAWSVLSVSLRGTNTVCVASGGSSSQNIGSTTTTNVKYTLKVGAEYAYTQNGTKTAIGGSSNTASDRHILMFAASDSSTGDQPYSWGGLGQCRIYNFKIYEGTTLIRDFVPVVRAYDGQACFWDNVTRGFYLNSGSGIFTTGESVLARGFTTKNYLQSSGTQYIDTGANLNMNTDSYEVKAQATSTTQNGMILGDWKVSNNYYWLYHYKDGSTIRMYLTNSSNSQTNFNTGLTNTNTNVNIFKYDGKKMYTNGSLTQDSSATTFSVATSTCYMFGCHYSDDKVGSWPYQGKIYYLKMWKEGRLIRDLVPAQRDFDGELGFYDLVTGLFFTNIGTGSFTAG